jgi:hypothetical protein
VTHGTPSGRSSSTNGPAHVEYSKLVGSASTGTGDGGIEGLVRLFAIPVFGGIALKIGNVLTRLGHR